MDLWGRLSIYTQNNQNKNFSNAMDSYSNLKNCLVVEKIYSDKGLPSSPVFPAGWINFGFWKGLNTVNSTKEERIQSCKNLYMLIFSCLEIVRGGRLLEVGCGTGNGCIYLSESFPESAVYGIDLSQDQVALANSKCADNTEIFVQFAQAKSDNIPYNANSFDGVYSIEAAQHFYNMKGYIEEAYRTLKHGGRFVLTTFFAMESIDKEIVDNLLPTVKSGIDILYLLTDVIELIECSGFRNISVMSIGDHVFTGFGHWVADELGEQAWGKNWTKAFEQGHIDYVVIIAKK